MHLRKFYIVFFMLSLWCNAQLKITSTIHPVYCDSSLITLDINHIELLDSLIEKAQNSQGEDNIEFERQFFCAMPNSFEGMFDVLYIDQIESIKKYQANGKLPTFHYPIHRFIYFFSKLESIEPNQYYNKYINICIDGFYGADDLRNGFQIYERLETDTKTICTVLSQRNEAEIKSVFHFIFDSSHPENELNQEIFDTIYPLVNAENERLGFLFKTSLEDVIKQKRH